MRETAHGNRGLTFEARIQAMHDAYSAAGVAVMVKVPTPARVVNGKCGPKWIRTASPAVDYVGALRDGTAVALEAKSTRLARWPLAMLTDEQVEFLRRWHGAGLVLVEFSDPELRSVWVLPAARVLADIARVSNRIASYAHPDRVGHRSGPSIDTIGRKCDGCDWAKGWAP